MRARGGTAIASLLLLGLAGCGAGRALPIGAAAPERPLRLLGWESLRVSGDRLDFTVRLAGEGAVRLRLDGIELRGCLRQPALDAVAGQPEAQQRLRCSLAELAAGEHRLLVLDARGLPDVGLRARGLAVEPPLGGPGGGAEEVAGSWWAPAGWAAPEPVDGPAGLFRWVSVGGGAANAAGPGGSVVCREQDARPGVDAALATDPGAPAPAATVPLPPGAFPLALLPLVEPGQPAVDCRGGGADAPTRALLATRRAHRALVAGSQRLLPTTAPGSEAWVRVVEAPDGSIASLALVAVNRQDAPLELRLPLVAELTRCPPLHDAWDGAPLPAAERALTVTVPGQALRLWVAGAP